MLHGYSGFILWGHCFFILMEKFVFHIPFNFSSLSVFLITFLLDTDMEKTLLSMLGEIIDFCSMRATIKTKTTAYYENVLCTK